MILDLDNLDEDPKEHPAGSSLNPWFGKLSQCQRYYTLSSYKGCEVFDAQTHLKLSSTFKVAAKGMIMNSDFCIITDTH